MSDKTNTMALQGHHKTKKWVGLILLALFGLLVMLIFKPTESKAKSASKTDWGVQRAVYNPKNPPATPAKIERKEQPRESLVAEAIQQEQIDVRAIEREKILMERRQAPIVVYQASGQIYQDSLAQSEQTHTQSLQVTANQIEHLDYTIIQGKLISGILESAINSDLPGMIRAVVKDNVYAEKGDRVLIPKGARLIGNYQSDLDAGQSRVFIIWQRLIRPDGIEIMLDSPGTNNLGQSGISGVVNNHFMARFGEAALLTMISAGSANINVSKGDEFNSKSAYRNAVSESFANSASQSLERTQGLSPTVHINQGSPIKVFVAKDLNFHSALTREDG